MVITKYKRLLPSEEESREFITSPFPPRILTENQRRKVQKRAAEAEEQSNMKSKSGAGIQVTAPTTRW